MSESDIAVLAGDDTLTWPLMSLGATGVVSVLGNLMPGEMTALVQAASQGDIGSARAWHHRLFPIARALLSLDTNPVPIKTALALRGILEEEFRLPMCPLDASKKAQLKAVLAAADGSRKARQIA
jgi:4-hydroxy-tetrahydrodipicolinate synthase